MAYCVKQTNALNHRHLIIMGKNYVFLSYLSLYCIFLFGGCFLVWDRLPLLVQPRGVHGLSSDLLAVLLIIATRLTGAWSHRQTR